jgi:crossover junction endodeoxyribonuclease RuvC
MRRILGIDPGLDGGLVMLDDNGEILSQNIMPTIKLKKKRMVDLRGVIDLFNKLDPHVCYLERVSARPGNGNVSMFNFGYGFGALEMGLAALDIPYVLVPPQTWCKVMHQGLAKDIEAKTRSLIVFKRSYPKIDLRASERCTIVHSGMLDALLIAEYGRRSSPALK